MTDLITVVTEDIYRNNPIDDFCRKARRIIVCGATSHQLLVLSDHYMVLLKRYLSNNHYFNGSKDGSSDNNS